MIKISMKYNDNVVPVKVIRRYSNENVLYEAMEQVGGINTTITKSKLDCIKKFLNAKIQCDRKEIKDHENSISCIISMPDDINVKLEHVTEIRNIIYCLKREIENTKSCLKFCDFLEGMMSLIASYNNYIFAEEVGEFNDRSF